MGLKPELIDELAKHCKTQDDLFGENGLVKHFINSMLQRAWMPN